MKMDNLNLMEILSYGHALMDTIYDKNLDKEIPVVFIKESQDYMDKFGDNPTIESRVGIINHKNVIGIVLQIKVNDDNEMLYETFVNCKTTLGDKLLEALSECDQCNIILIDGEGQPKRRISIINPFFEPLRDKYDEIKKGSWTFEEFDELVQGLYERYTTSTDLWNALGNEIK